ncbi:MAG: LysR substrate-binding domain-containing protein [Rhodospirillales bacterium]
MEATPEGEAYAREVRDALARLGMATRRFVDATLRHPVRIAIQPVICHYWLFPLLAEFRLKFPDIHLDLVGSDHPRDDFRRDADFAIDFGSLADARAAGHVVLFQRTATPVCSADFLQRYGPLRGAEDLHRLPLLHNLSAGDEWREWFGVVESDRVPVAQYQFHGRALTLAAAQRGLGMALGCRNMLRADIRAGTLVTPFDSVVDYDEVYFLIMSSALDEVGMMSDLIRWFQALSS